MLNLKLQLNKDTCHDFDAVTTREWLETNGIGGYSSASISGANTRRYHGILVSAVVPPVDRFVMLSKLDEVVQFGGAQLPLHTNIYSGAVDPRGYENLTSFERGIFPQWLYDFPEITIRKTVGMIHGQNTTVVEYQVLKAPAPFSMTLRPFIAARGYHQLTRANDAINRGSVYNAGTLTLRPYDILPSIKLHLANGTFTSDPSWFNNFEYPIERARGFDYNEDLFTPGVFEVTLNKGSLFSVVITTETSSVTNGRLLLQQESERREELLEKQPSRNPVSDALTLAADQFIARRGSGLTVMAGYPWFTDWGRDTMIALPGLTLATNRFSDAKSILTTFLKSVDRGMIPNVFPDGDKPPLFNTVDATLWMFVAIRAYWKATGDKEFVSERALPVLLGILMWHTRGTRFQIHEDTDGLLYAGDPSVQLTWMDAKIGTWVVTPRDGKAVEIQALWYNANCIVAELLAECGQPDESKPFKDKAQKIAASFSRKFWSAEKGYFFDCINDQPGIASADATLRPNQLLALSLPFPLSSEVQAHSVLKIVGDELYTAVGMRTLSPKDPAYHGHYRGTGQERDAAYHQGTVWAWLLGPYASALLRYKSGAEGAATARSVVENLLPHLLMGCVGSISEIFDADEPHFPKGACAQAWSVAEVLRVYREILSRS